MKKNLIIIILAIISVASLIFGYSQKQKADEHEVLAKKYSEALIAKERQEEIARKNQKKAIEEAQQIWEEAGSDQKNQ